MQKYAQYANNMHNIKNMLDILQLYAKNMQNMQNICKIVQNICKIYAKNANQYVHVQKICTMCKVYAKNMQRAKPISTIMQHIHQDAIYAKICKKCSKNMQNICTLYKLWHQYAKHALGTLLNKKNLLCAMEPNSLTLEAIQHKKVIVKFWLCSASTSTFFTTSRSVLSHTILESKNIILLDQFFLFNKFLNTKGINH